MALAIYLRALGCRTERIDELIRVLRAMAHDDAVLPLRLAEGAGEMLRALDAKDGSPGCRAMFANPDVRAAMIAMRIIDAGEPGIDSGRLGCEWDLSMRFATSRLVMRQALRVLRDFDMLETRRGRGGGVFLKRPAPIAIVRQLFSYLASEGHTVQTSLEKLWILNLANLRLASARLAGMTAPERERWIAQTGAVLDVLEEPQRWVVLQQALASLSDNVLLDTLARCMACFQARQGLPVPRQPPEIVDALLAHERAVLAALGAGRRNAAEAAHGAAQALMGWLVRAAGTVTPANDRPA
jgi:DNA-binding FadR family transcriptional regulator